MKRSGPRPLTASKAARRGWSPAGKASSQAPCANTATALKPAAATAARRRFARRAAGEPTNRTRDAAGSAIAPATVVTMAAAFGTSKATKTPPPARLAKMQAAQPTASAAHILCENKKPIKAGMIRKEKTRSTPASATELVTTTPKGQ